MSMRSFDAMRSSAAEKATERISHRLETVKRVSAAMGSAHPKFHEHARQQASTVTSLCSTLRGLTDEDLASLTRKIVDVGFPSDLEGEVIKALTLQETANTKRNNAPLQKYESIFRYFTPSQYKHMDGKTPNVILATIIDHAIDLDLRRPSCPTIGMLTALYKCLAIGLDSLLDVSKIDKYNEVSFVKNVFHQRVKFAKPPLSIVDILPESPSTFIECYPSTGSIFEDEIPSVCPFDEATLLAVADSFPLRKPKPMAPLSTALNVASLDSQANPCGGGGGSMQAMNAMASFFMQAMQNNPGMMKT